MKTSILLMSFAIFSVGCSTTETIPEPVAVQEPIVKTVAIDDVVLVKTPTVEEETLVQGVPDIKQAQVIGVIRELRKGGCVVKQYARTSGIHYKQLVVTCGDPEKAPAIPQ